MTRSGTKTAQPVGRLLQRDPGAFQVVGGDHDLHASESRVEKLDVHPGCRQLAGEFPERSRLVGDIQYQHLAAIGDAHAGPLEPGDRAVDDVVGEQHMDDPPALSGERAQALEFTPAAPVASPRLASWPGSFRRITVRLVGISDPLVGQELIAAIVTRRVTVRQSRYRPGRASRITVLVSRKG
jgi:hypothetical protein